MMQSNTVPPGLGSPGPGESQPNTESDNALFMNSTISQDDTVEDISKKRDMLSKFTNRPGKGRWLLTAV